jgi:integrase
VLKEDNGRIVFLTAAQAESLLEAAKADQNRQIYPFILIGLRTGMRKSEILTIRRENIDLDARSIYIPQAMAGARTQPISADLASFLADYLETLPKGTPWLFPSIGALHGHTVDIRKAFAPCDLSRSRSEAGRPPYFTTHSDNPFGAGGSRSADSKTDQRSQNDGNGGTLRASVRRAYCGRNGKA